jgi:catechol 2,3-dioxygenase-like lactoylglutathione lyase family enzyme
MSEVRAGGSSYTMPPKHGITIAQFLTVADVKRSVRFYEKVFDAKIVYESEESGDPACVQIANTWLILNTGGGPTDDKPKVILETPPKLDRVNSFMNIRVADIHACYKLWKSRGATFLTPPIEREDETRCYIRDPDGYLIEVGQDKPDDA